MISKELDKSFFIYVFIFLLLLVYSSLPLAQNVKTYIPEKAYPLLPVFKKEHERLSPVFPYYPYYPALAEHESCISLKHSRCMSPSSELKTSREQGVGLPQITRVWRNDGSLRFDKLQEMRDKYDDELRELSWLTIKERPELQIRILVILTQENWKKFFMISDDWQRLAMSDSAYNGGAGDVDKARRICGLKKGCDPQVWFGNVESVIPKSTVPLYGTRSAKDINLHHVDDVLNNRYNKYNDYYHSTSY